MKTETYDDATLFLAALHGKPRQTRGRATRPDIPSAGKSAPTGLTTLLAGKGRVYVWSIAHEVGKGYRLYVIGRPALNTGWHADEAGACRAAKEMER